MPHVKASPSAQSSLTFIQSSEETSPWTRNRGHITHSDLPVDETHTIPVPGAMLPHCLSIKIMTKSNIKEALCRRCQWITGAQRTISCLILKCVTCRKLHAKLEQQQMADLPQERLQQEPPFTYVGLDVFGPWEVYTGQMQGGSSNSKRWAVLFICMSTRAIHIEAVESMSASSCITALLLSQRTWETAVVRPWNQGSGPEEDSVENYLHTQRYLDPPTHL